MKLENVTKAKELIVDYEDVKAVLDDLHKTLLTILEKDDVYGNNISEFSDGSGWSVDMSDVVQSSDIIEFAIHKAKSKKEEIEAEIKSL